MKKSLIILLVGSLAATFSMSTQAEIYKWKDSKGVTHYSSRPPTQQQLKTKSEVKNIGKKIRSAAGKYNPATSQNKGDQQNSTENDGNTDASELSKPSKKLVTYCKNQRKNLETLQKNFRNIWVDKNGIKTKLDQKQRLEKVNTLKKSISEDCRGV